MKFLVLSRVEISLSEWEKYDFVQRSKTRPLAQNRYKIVHIIYFQEC